MINSYTLEVTKQENAHFLQIIKERFVKLQMLQIWFHRHFDDENRQNDYKYGFNVILIIRNSYRH